jgi:rifampin ADP-ribosylating transferase
MGRLREPVPFEVYEAGVYLHGTKADLGRELARGACRGRIYIVEPTGEFEDDPNVTGKKFPGNSTQSFRSREPLRVVGEVVDWARHPPPEKLEAMRTALDSLERDGKAQIED